MLLKSTFYDCIKQNIEMLRLIGPKYNIINIFPKENSGYKCAKGHPEVTQYYPILIIN